MVSDNNAPIQTNFEPQGQNQIGQLLQINGMSNNDQLTLDLAGLNDLTSVSLPINAEDMLLQKMSSELMEACARETIDETGSSEPSTPSSPGLLSPGSQSVTSPESIFSDTCTQLSLVERSEGLNLADELSTVDSNTFWSMVSDDAAMHPDALSRKSFKASRNDAPSSATTPSEENTSLVFEADAAVCSSQFVFTKFGSDVPGIFTFGATNSPRADTATSSVISGGRSSADVAPKLAAAPMSDLDKQMQETAQALVSVANSTTSGTTTKRSKSPQNTASLQQGTMPTKRLKEPSLNLSFPSKAGQYELKLIVQPEDQHRARYMTEGSRGAVKDKSQQGHPVIQLFGYQNPVTLKVFVGTDAGKVKPHGFYQACKVCGKNSTSCEESDVEGTTVIEINLDPKDDMKASIDCVGILKLRNADVEQRIGLARSKKKSTRARLVFRVNLPKLDGTYQTLQVASTPISCTQPAGMPELCKKSMTECSAEGGEELFIIGKNFTRGTKVKFQQFDVSGRVAWTAEAAIDQEYFNQGHMIVIVPKYKDAKITRAVEVQIVAESSGRRSEPQSFTYKPVLANVTERSAPMIVDMKEEIAMDVTEDVKPPKSFVSPEALKLNRMFMEQTGGSDSVLLTAPDTAGLPQTTSPVQPQASPLIPTCVEEQGLKVSQIVADLASPVGAQTHHLQPQVSEAQQLSPTSPLGPQQQVILQTQQQPIQLQKVTLAAPLQQGQIITIPVTNSSVSVPAGFTLCQLNGKRLLVSNNNVVQKAPSVGDLPSSVDTTQGHSALLDILTSPMEAVGATTTTSTMVNTTPLSTTSAGAAGLQSPSTDVTRFPNISVADVDRLLNNGNL